MSEQTYLVPRQVTSRFEFLPGWGLPEATGLVLGLGLSYVVYQGVSLLGAPAQVTVGAATVPAFVCITAAKGRVHILRFLNFANEQKRFLYRSGTGSAAAAKTQETPRGGGSLMLKVFWAMFKAKPKAEALSPAVRTAQDWLPVTGVQSGLVRRKDGGVVAAIRVEALNLGLKSTTEQVRIIGALHEAINSLQHPIQILSIPRPLDLDAYVRSLERRLQEVDSGRQRLLRPYIKHVSNLVSGGETQERRHYILLPWLEGAKSEDEVRQWANDLRGRLHQAGLNCHVLDDVELLDLLHVWSHPGQAAFERPPVAAPSVTTLLDLGGVNVHAHPHPQTT